jgi:hypothetical protein
MPNQATESAPENLTSGIRSSVSPQNSCSPYRTISPLKVPLVGQNSVRDFIPKTNNLQATGSKLKAVSVPSRAKRVCACACRVPYTRESQMKP